MGTASLKNKTRRWGTWLNSGYRYFSVPEKPSKGPKKVSVPLCRVQSFCGLVRGDVTELMRHHTISIVSPPFVSNTLQHAPTYLGGVFQHGCTRAAARRGADLRRRGGWGRGGSGAERGQRFRQKRLLPGHATPTLRSRYVYVTDAVA